MKHGANGAKAKAKIRLKSPVPAETLMPDIAGTVAAMTESDPGVESEKPPTTPLVNRDSATRRARRLAVQYDVGKLCFPFEKCS